jgi:hypothetical protein
LFALRLFVESRRRSRNAAKESVLGAELLVRTSLFVDDADGAIEEELASVAIEDGDVKNIAGTPGGKLCCRNSRSTSTSCPLGCKDDFRVLRSVDLCEFSSLIFAGLLSNVTERFKQQYGAAAQNSFNVFYTLRIFSKVTPESVLF